MSKKIYLSLQENKKLTQFRSGFWGEYLGLRGMEQQEAGGKYIMKSSIFLLFTKYWRYQVRVWDELSE
jgi:hypothetical protein